MGMVMVWGCCSGSSCNSTGCGSGGGVGML